MGTTTLLPPDLDDDEMFGFNPLWNLQTSHDALQSEHLERKRCRSIVDDDAEQIAPCSKRLKDQHDNSWEFEPRGEKRPRSMAEIEEALLESDRKRAKLAASIELFQPVQDTPADGIGVESVYSHHDQPSTEAQVNSAGTQPETIRPKKPRKIHARIGKNRIRYTNENGLEVEIGINWVPAIEHPDYVSRFSFHAIDPANYAHERAFGHDAGDFTAYLPSQHGWGGKREARPDILFIYECPKSGWQSSSPLLLTYNDNGIDRVVVDVINHRPLRDFANLPITISTKVEGWLMEAWERQDRSIEFEDLIQRMPFAADDEVWNSRKFTNALTQRKDRFRNRGRCLSWKMIEHDRQWDRKLKQDMEANKDWLRANTTRYLNDLTIEEDRALEAATFLSRKHVQRGGRRQLQGDAKIKKEARMRKVLEGGKKKNAAAGKDLQRSSQIPDNHSEKTIHSEALKEADNFSVDEATYVFPANSDDVQQQSGNILETCPLEALMPESESQLRETNSKMEPSLPNGTSLHDQESNQPASIWCNEVTPHAYPTKYLGGLPHEATVNVGQKLQTHSNDSWEFSHVQPFLPECTENQFNDNGHQWLPASMSPAMQSCLDVHRHLPVPAYPSFDVSTSPETTVLSGRSNSPGGSTATSSTIHSRNSFDKTAVATTRQNSPPAKKRTMGQYSQQPNADADQYSHCQQAAYEQQADTGRSRGKNRHSDPLTTGYRSRARPRGAQQNSKASLPVARTGHRLRTQAETLPYDDDESIYPQHEQYSATAYRDENDFFAGMGSVSPDEETPELRPNSELESGISIDLLQSLDSESAMSIGQWLDSEAGKSL